MMFAGFFASTIGRLVIGAVIASAIVGIVTVGLNKYKSEIKEAVYQQFYAAQVEAKLKDEQDKADRLKKDLAARERAIVILNQDRQMLISNLERIRTNIVNQEQAGPVSPTIRATIEDLRLLVDKSRKAGEAANQ